MERAGGRPKDLDIWKHVTVMEGKRVKCNHCGLVFAASANRIKSHINQIKGNGIRLCTRVPQPNNIGSNQRVDGDLKENLTDSQGLSILDRPRDYNKLNEKMLNCYMSPKTMWEGIIAHRQVQTNVETKHHEKIQVGPFSVSNMVNVQDLQLIQYVFNLSPDECETYTVFSSSHSFLNQSEFTTLKPQTLLDSLVIDIFAEILTNIERKKKTTALNWYLPVTFSTAAIDGDESSFLNFVERQKMRETYMSELVHCEKMFIPVHVQKNSFGHFYLYIIHLKNKEVEIWDSLSNLFINEEERDGKTQKLLFVLDKLFMDDKWKTSWTFTKFDLRMAENTPLQPNEYDCGIFVINFMQQSANYVKINPSFQFDSDEERLDLTLKLLKSDINQRRKDLYHEAAKRHYAQGGNENDSDLQGVKRKLTDPCKTLSEDDPREADIELGDSDRRVRSKFSLEKGCAKDYLLPTTDLVGEAFQIYTERIWEWLMRDEVAVIGVWGMGGVGKTTLLTHIHNKLLEGGDGDFDHISWVTVSQHHGISQLQKVIARSINLDISDEYEVKTIAARLLHAFKRINKCVLILDNVWDHIFLEEVGFPVSDNGNKLILTTRSWEVCQSMDCKDKMIEVKPLDEGDGWDLFKRTLGVHQRLSCEVEGIARTMTKECGGLPLAIITIARSMKGIEDVAEWNYMLESLQSLENGQYDMEKWVFPVLGSSYAHLNNKLQRYFLYCALCINVTCVKDLTRRFVHEGWIDGTKKLKAQYDEGHNILKKLRNSSLLKIPCDWKWEMHNLVRAMAVSIVKETNKIMAKTNMNLIEIPDESQWKKDLEKVFLTGNKIQKIPDGASPMCSQLSTLLLDGNKDLKLISDDFFTNMPALRVIDLSKTGIKCLPKSVSNLECLVALLLSGCNTLSYVPSLAKLQRLISLDLSATSITEAPSGLELLVNLRRLNLLETEQLKMSTSSIISKMTNLKSLYLNCVPESMDVSAEDLEGLEELEAISANFCDIEDFNEFCLIWFPDSSRLLQNYYLCLTKTRAYDINRFIGGKYNVPAFEGLDLGNTKVVAFEGLDLGKAALELPVDIKEFYLYECRLREERLCHVLSFLVLSFLENNNNPCKIEYFEIGRCDNMKYLCCSDSDCSFCSSVQFAGCLRLWDLKDLQNLSDETCEMRTITQFSHLTHLSIDRCNSMETLLTPGLLLQLQNLEIIRVSNCKSMKEIISERSGEEDFSEMAFLISGNYSDQQPISLPKLKNVELDNLPELNFVCRGIIICPSLQYWKIKDCGKLILPKIEAPLFR